MNYEEAAEAYHRKWMRQLRIYTAIDLLTIAVVAWSMRKRNK